MPHQIPEPKIEEVVAEKLITLHEACEMLGVSEKTHWVRVVHELTRDASPWVAVRLQALKR